MPPLEVSLDIVTTAALLFVVALGLLIVLGVLKVINFAHAAFLTLGAYAGVLTNHLSWSPWLMFLIAPIMGATIGMAVERLVVRPLYSRPLDTVLATWGVTLVLIQVITLIFGAQGQYVNTPAIGNLRAGDFSYSGVRIAIAMLAIALGAGLALFMARTELGLKSRAVIMNEELAMSLGINADRVRFFTFTLGCALASFSGAALALLSSVDPNLGVPWLVTAFMLVLVAGVSLWGLAVAAIFLGGVQFLVNFYGSPTVGSLTIIVLALVVLRLRPEGFSRG